MSRVIFAIVCIEALIFEMTVANPILASAFPGLQLPSIKETCVDTISPVIPRQQIVPSSNVVITDSSQSVCNNLANTLQLLIVSKLLQGNLGCGLPWVNEFPVASPVITTGLGPVVSSPVLAPGLVSSSVLPNFMQNILPNGMVSSTSCGCNTAFPQIGGPIIL